MSVRQTFNSTAAVYWNQLLRVMGEGGEGREVQFTSIITRPNSGTALSQPLVGLSVNPSLCTEIQATPQHVQKKAICKKYVFLKMCTVSNRHQYLLT